MKKVQLIPHKIRVIGLTGGVATGKSSVARFFAEKGVPVLDADQLAREVVLPASRALAQIVVHFGSDVLTQEGILDRKRLGTMVFSNPDKRRLLEEILHPEIRKLSEIRIAEVNATGHERLIYMAPLLIEAGGNSRVDTIWVVTVHPEVQVERLMQRDDITREQAQKIIDSQMLLSEKERYGTVVIDNSGSETETRKILESVWSQETGSSNG
jgi:dephospho-CoA kinase